ncbi:unnamed protein product [Vicia faba]|uniref:Uncharacterized protein n=1 Tax=Vicia faba TaxID=3906 RepID=A0AAV0ZMS5_VICFA|nr:unnamed protein product [Vicia faba]
MMPMQLQGNCKELFLVSSLVCFSLGFFPIVALQFQDPLTFSVSRFRSIHSFHFSDSPTMKEKDERSRISYLPEIVRCFFRSENIIRNLAMKNDKVDAVRMMYDKVAARFSIEKIREIGISNSSVVPRGKR